MKKSIILNSALVFFGLTVSLLLCEIMIRIILQEDIVEDDMLETVHSPGGQWDSLGWRNSEAQLTTSAVIAIGDSQTYGHNAITENAWPQVYAKLADKEVYQMALGGYGFVNYAHLFDIALKESPETIIVGFYLGNDLSDTLRLAYNLDAWSHLRTENFFITDSSNNDFIDVQKQARFSDTQSFLKTNTLRARSWIRRHSKLYDFASVATVPLRQSVGLMKTQEDIDARIADFTQYDISSAYVFPHEVFKTILSPNYRINALNREDQNTQEGWRITQKLIQQMQAKAKQNNVNFEMVLIPTKEHVYQQYLAKNSSKLPDVFNDITTKEKELLATIINFCSDQSLECHDSTSVMVSTMSNNVMIYTESLDGHPADAGYIAIAKAIFESQNTPATEPEI